MHRAPAAKRLKRRYAQDAAQDKAARKQEWLARIGAMPVLPSLTDSGSDTDFEAATRGDYDSDMVNSPASAPRGIAQSTGLHQASTLPQSSFFGNQDAVCRSAAPTSASHPRPPTIPPFSSVPPHLKPGVYDPITPTPNVPWPPRHSRPQMLYNLALKDVNDEFFHFHQELETARAELKKAREELRGRDKRYFENTGHLRREIDNLRAERDGLQVHNDNFVRVILGVKGEGEREEGVREGLRRENEGLREEVGGLRREREIWRGMTSSVFEVQDTYAKGVERVKQQFREAGLPLLSGRRKSLSEADL